MSHWWKYPISDVLPFSLEVYYRFLGGYGQIMWPWQLLALLVGFAVLSAICFGRPNTARLVILALGVSWLLVAGFYFHNHYGQLFWAAPYFAGVFAVQGALLLASAAASHSFTTVREPRGTMAALVLASAVVIYPVMGTFVVGSGRVVETLAFFPDPTAIATLAVLASLRGRLRWSLMVIPLIWCIVASTILVTLGGVGGILLAVLSCLALAAAFAPARSALA